MKTTLRLIAFGLYFLSFTNAALATHNRAGEIYVEQINGCNSNMVRCSIFTYTKTSSVQADRDTLTLCWGDANQTCVQVARANGPQPDPNLPPQGQPMANDVKYNIYVAEFQYDGPGHYVISATDPNRNGGIINVNFPGSENVQFHIQTAFTVFNGQFEGCNSSPLLLQPPIDYACLGEVFVHNPNAYDADGDQLTYELMVPLQGVNSPVPNYAWPQNVGVNNGCCLDLNNLTGTLTWNVPKVKGEFNIAMRIISWRNGVAIDTTVRDMQIFVEDCNGNHAPVINTIDEICVVAGDVVEFNVTATDPDAGDKIKLSALGAPFLVEYSPADDADTWRPEGNPSATYKSQPVSKTFRWQTSCEHISDLPYTVVFKAEDDFFFTNMQGLTTGLATLKAVRIKVVGPPPADVKADPSSDRITVSWAKPYQCEDAKEDYFFAFSVWRKEGSNQFPLDTCDPGLAGKGYVKIANTLDVSNGRYTHVDTDVERGRTYCYRILGVFAKRTDSGHPYNQVESLASEEVCIQLSRDVPLITNVSVQQTSTSNGIIEVKWTKPVAEDLDTLLNHGPYRYELKRARDIAGTNYTTIANFDSPTFWQLTQNSFVDQAGVLDTKGNPYNYKIDFFVNNENSPIGDSPSASSVWLQIEPTDNRNILTWKYEVPWVNYEYVIYRQNGTVWDSIGFTKDSVYVDKGLLNGREYCYYIKAKGSYGIADIPSPLINLSQEVCSTPIDNVAPCPPALEVSNICNSGKSCQEQEKLENLLLWDNPMNICEETDDVVSYRIYYKPFENGDFELIAEVNDSGDTIFNHQPERGLAGCYAVTALDTFLNESELSNIICTDNCPTYELPNAFTPNGDGANELFIPYPYCFIESIEITIFNRWGELVYKTKDPNINWDGNNLNGKPLPSSTYYYTCKVFEQRVTGTVLSPNLLRGYIDLIR
ncbi:MAG: gliding motility-associated C-terminal domain-containing protein [Saprospiraceae bacterium]|nr:gliding motility-associated C-terminal domain-containing protein [Saprospiraceae bacterium]MCF8249874.1 gliding motility-associated C-terminal domain-containing protein [Saprospiraceae bacterium]MCF8279456.1 gliding motility-associated C-terminal domain-containing protein [Bacteroidales bacterium]MCF8311692.1 gliding motility-associated C-terminal domain-containing protein [Saprospiraceae bacterium]MCF8440259.1 gliding motility-associated C-terminal domain-containing protein [Saprospiraceae 